MGTFSSITAGTFARRTVALDVAGRRTLVDVRVMSPAEEAVIIAQATAFAKGHGMEDPREGDPLYEYGRWLHTCILACVDPDSAVDKPMPFFDGGADQILSSNVLTRAHLGYLAQQQEIWQDENSPYDMKATDDNVLERVEKIAEGDIGPFGELPPVMQWRLVRTMASRYMALLALKSTSGSGSAESLTPQSDGSAYQPQFQTSE